MLCLQALSRFSQARNTEAPVAVVIDGVLRTGRTQLQQELYDVQQIEVFKGPQGFLYGRNAIAGAIVINTKKPDDEWSGKFNIGYGYANLMYSSFGAGGAIRPDAQIISSLRNDLISQWLDSAANARITRG